jgi:hypothetical protein
MPFRFNRRVSIIPGLRVNLGKRGISASVGPRGAHYTIGTRGQRVSLDAVGTGFGWFKTVPWSRGGRAAASRPLPRWVVVLILAGLIALAVFGGH